MAPKAEKNTQSIPFKIAFLPSRVPFDDLYNGVSRKSDDSEKALSKSRQRNGEQQDRSVLIDITNDSPIVGLAGGNLKMPCSSIVKQKVKNTPGSGETLLRGQVKNLLQKVEEEAVLSKISLERIFGR